MVVTQSRALLDELSWKPSIRTSYRQTAKRSEIPIWEEKSISRCHSCFLFGWELYSSRSFIAHPCSELLNPQKRVDLLLGISWLKLDPRICTARGRSQMAMALSINIMHSASQKDLFHVGPSRKHALQKSLVSPCWMSEFYRLAVTWSGGWESCSRSMTLLGMSEAVGSCWELSSWEIGKPRNLPPPRLHRQFHFFLPLQAVWTFATAAGAIISEFSFRHHLCPLQQLKVTVYPWTCWRK